MIMDCTKRTREDIAHRVAADIYNGAYVNLGIGMPTLVANYLPCDTDVVLHSENGVLGMGPAPADGHEDYDLVNASKMPVTIKPGAAFFHHADSFAMMRGGHIDICVLGAFQVSANGDLANWSTGQADAIPGVGGAMDLAVGAKETWIMMDLLTRSGEPKLVPSCSYPITAQGCVKRIYTEYATFLNTGKGFTLMDAVDGVSIEALERIIGFSLVQT